MTPIKSISKRFSVELGFLGLFKLNKDFLKVYLTLVWTLVDLLVTLVQRILVKVKNKRYAAYHMRDYFDENVVIRLK